MKIFRGSAMASCVILSRSSADPCPCMEVMRSSAARRHTCHRDRMQAHTLHQTSLEHMSVEALEQVKVHPNLDCSNSPLRMFEYRCNQVPPHLHFVAYRLSQADIPHPNRNLNQRERERSSHHVRLNHTSQQPRTQEWVKESLTSFTKF